MEGIVTSYFILFLNRHMFQCSEKTHFFLTGFLFYFVTIFFFLLLLPQCHFFVIVGTCVPAHQSSEMSFSQAIRVPAVVSLAAGVTYFPLSVSLAADAT